MLPHLSLPNHTGERGPALVVSGVTLVTAAGARSFIVAPHSKRSKITTKIMNVSSTQARIMVSQGTGVAERRLIQMTDKIKIKIKSK